MIVVVSYKHIWRGNNALTQNPCGSGRPNSENVRAVPVFNSYKLVWLSAAQWSGIWRRRCRLSHFLPPFVLVECKATSWTQLFNYYRTDMAYRIAHRLRCRGCLRRLWSILQPRQNTRHACYTPIWSTIEQMNGAWGVLVEGVLKILQRHYRH